MRGLSFATGLLCVLASSFASADSNSLTNYFGPREISVGESMRAQATGNMSTTLNPAGLSLNRQLEFNGAYGFRPEDKASVISVSACDSTVAVPGCFYYNYFGAEAELSGSTMSRRAHQFGVVASRAITEHVHLGINSKYFDYESELSGEEDVSGFALDAGLVIRLGGRVNLAAVGYNLIAEDSPEYPRAVASGISLFPVNGLSVAFDARWDLEKKDDASGMRLGGGAEYFVTSSRKQSGFPLRAGAVRDQGTETTSFTAGIGYVTTRVGVDLGMRKDVSGGKDFIFQAGLRLFGPK